MLITAAKPKEKVDWLAKHEERALGSVAVFVTRIWGVRSE
jgi:hypothetical protein